LGRFLIVLQVALCCGILVPAVHAARSVLKLGTMNMGFSTAGVLTTRVALPDAYTDTLRLSTFFSRLLTQLQAIPGTTAAAFTSVLPGFASCCEQVALEGQTYANQFEYASASRRAVTPSFFSLLEVPIIEGRTFGVEDRLGAPPVVVVDRAFAER